MESLPTSTLSSLYYLSVGDEVLNYRHQVVVEALKHHGIRYMFGVVGIPVVEIAIAAQQVSTLNKE
jgi:hypothetical protein